jgi:hypothetical protein
MPGSSSWQRQVGGIAVETWIAGTHIGQSANDPDTVLEGCCVGEAAAARSWTGCEQQLVPPWRHGRRLTVIPS